MAPIFIPNSRVTDVSLLWPQWDPVDDVAEKAVDALAQSDESVVTVHY